mmetsp:Transcript_74332/g.170452  ORF Transcript_74332/g.170452 Transcript_74332/m.170452 type:complete len:316 (-) Transcript_74332:402-1349(-)
MVVKHTSPEGHEENGLLVLASLDLLPSLQHSPKILGNKQLLPHLPLESFLRCIAGWVVVGAYRDGGGVDQGDSVGNRRRCCQRWVQAGCRQAHGAEDSHSGIPLLHLLQHLRPVPRRQPLRHVQVPILKPHSLLPPRRLPVHPALPQQLIHRRQPARPTKGGVGHIRLRTSVVEHKLGRSGVARELPPRAPGVVPAVLRDPGDDAAVGGVFRAVELGGEDEDGALVEGALDIADYLPLVDPHSGLEFSLPGDTLHHGRRLYPEALAQRHHSLSVEEPDVLLRRPQQPPHTGASNFGGVGSAAAAEPPDSAESLHV